MKYFENVKTKEELKARYKELTLKYHPDIYGEKGNEIMKEIHNQLEKAVENIDKGYVDEFIEDDVIETDEIIAKKKEFAELASQSYYPDGTLFALYWTNGLRPRNHRNPITKHNFSGWNVWELELQMYLRGYKSAEWSTFAQYRQAENNIRKGEKGTYITLAIISKKKDENDDKEKTSVYYKGYTVFNLEQTKEQEVKVIETTKQIETKQDKFAGYEVVA